MRLLALVMVASGIGPSGPASPAPPPLAETVCSVHCDTLDPAQAQQDTTPVPQVDLNGRRLVLHVSDTDAMAWGSIDGGTAGDTVWLDRTWTGGSSWDGLLGTETVPAGAAGTRTRMYNLADPAGHRRGMIRACGDAAAVRCTEWAHLRVCAAACDGSTGPVGDHEPVPATTLNGRRIALHTDDRGMAWAALTAGTTGDEVWLDRSWNEGASWPDGSSLGRLSVPAGSTGTQTTLYAGQDPRSRLYGGAVRACGRAVEGQNGSCTAWARPATDRAGAGADGLMYAYRPDTAWWPSSWWNSAVAVTTVMDYQERTGRRDYDWIVNRTFEVNKGVFPAGVKSTDPIEGNFISRAIDDTAWWGIAWIQAYDLTGATVYRDMAVTIASYVHEYWDGTCGGGVWWDRERTYKNAVTNGLYIRLAAALHNRLPGDTVWLDRARAGWNWFTASGMINGSNLVNDGVDTASCRNNGQTVWTYNQGLAIGAALELWRATGDAGLLEVSRRLADAAIGSPLLSPGGILTEWCDAPDRSCDDNQKQFKGVFMRYLTDLADATGSAPYRTYAEQQADSIWNHDRDALNRLGQRWNGQTNPSHPNVRDWRTQASALNPLMA